LVETPLIPDYGGACITNVMPALLEPSGAGPHWLPPDAHADQIVLLVLDGLGWEQLQARSRLAPTMCAMTGDAILTVAPSTTSSALTSISTGMSPGEHGVIGYRMDVEGEILNVLRWWASGRDARDSIPPDKIQQNEPFLGQRPPVVTRAEFRYSGFTQAHLEGVRFSGYRMPSTLVAETARLVRAGEPFVYTYYDGVDKVAHEYGLADHYDAEIVAVDRLVEYLIAVLPSSAALVLTSDHGQVDVGDNLVVVHKDVLAHVSYQSGEGRFRWLHARPGHARVLLEAATERHADTGWIVGQEQMLDEHWFGPVVSEEARARLGDVALVAREPIAYVDVDDTGPFELIARHGSLTSAEMRVPLLVARGAA
jgi:predicted AlkP superfamily pyrophosphatase or phosphodiesterase